jgi:hypothetical protein
MKSSDISIRPARAGDIQDFFGSAVPETIRAFVAEYRGVPHCIAGIYLFHGKWIVFSDVKSLDLPKMTIWRGANMLMEKLKSLNVPMTAIPDDGICGSERFLERMGFTKTQGGLYTWQS